MLQIYTLDTENITSQELLQYCNTEAHNIPSAAAHLLLKAKACDILGIEHSNLSFSKTENGKPFLKDYTNFHFNISHSSSRFAVAISSSPVGVDIEKLCERNLKIANRRFTKSEVAYIDGDTNRFIEVWTKKEAYIKFGGKTMAELSAFDVTERPLSENFHTLCIDGYILTVYSEECKKPSTYPLSKTEFFEFLRKAFD